MSRYRKTMSEAMAEVQKISEKRLLEPKNESKTDSKHQKNMAI